MERKLKIMENDKHPLDDLKNLYDRAVKSFEVIGSDVYIVDNASSKLYLADFNGNRSAVTSDSVGEWVSD